MNNLDREQFIFNFLEGNLSKSEHHLCLELIATDNSFKQEVELWESSYYQRDINGPHLHDKEVLMPQKSFKKFWVLGGLLVTLLVGYTFIKQEKRTDELEHQVNELQDKINHSNKIRPEKKIFTTQEKVTDQSSKLQKKTQHDKKGETTPILREKNEYYELQKGSNSSIKTPEKMADLVSPKQGELKPGQRGDIDTISANNVKDLTNDSIKDAPNKTEEAIIKKEDIMNGTKPQETQSSKKRKRLKDLLKDQRITPME